MSDERSRCLPKSAVGASFAARRDNRAPAGDCLQQPNKRNRDQPASSVDAHDAPSENGDGDVDVQKVDRTE